MHKIESREISNWKYLSKQYKKQGAYSGRFHLGRINKSDRKGSCLERRVYSTMQRQIYHEQTD